MAPQDINDKAVKVQCCQLNFFVKKIHNFKLPRVPSCPGLPISSQRIKRIYIRVENTNFRKYILWISKNICRYFQSLFFYFKSKINNMHGYQYFNNFEFTAVYVVELPFHSKHVVLEQPTYILCQLGTSYTYYCSRYKRIFFYGIFLLSKYFRKG